MLQGVADRLLRHPEDGGVGPLRQDRYASGGISGGRTAGGAAGGRITRLVTQKAIVEQVNVDAERPGGGHQLGQVAQSGCGLLDLLVTAQQAHHGAEPGKGLLGLSAQLLSRVPGRLRVAVDQSLERGRLHDDPGQVMGGDVVQLAGQAAALLDEGHLQLPAVLAPEELLTGVLVPATAGQRRPAQHR